MVLLGYNAVYIRKLSDVVNSRPGKFDAKSYVQKLWAGRLQEKLDSAIDVNTLKESLQTDPADGFGKYTHALAIGNYRYAMVKGIAMVDVVKEDEVLVTIQSAQPFKAVVLTEFVYGNTLRDASGLIDLQAFPNTGDLNGVSGELNKKVRQEVIPALKSMLKPGNKIEFTGAVELNKAHLRFDDIEIVPVRIKRIS